MSDKKIHIQSNTIQETLVIPLWGRKYCSEIYPELYRDPTAEKIMDKLDYDFSALEEKKSGTMFRFGYLEAAARYMDLGIEIRDYLKDHPAAAVVNLGCGLDCTAENNAGSDCKIYNIDRPDVIEVRNQLIPPTEQVTNIGADLNDTAWFDQIDDSRGVVFIAAGVFYYFLSEEVKKLFTAMSERFHGGRLAFDAANKSAVKLMLKTWVKTAGITDVSKYFYINNPDTDLKEWLPDAKISAKGYLLGYHDLKVPSVIQGFHSVKLTEYLGKTTLICIAAGFCDFRDSELGGCQKLCGIFHAHFVHVGGYVCAVHGAEIPFQAGFADIQSLGDGFHGSMPARILRQHLLRPFGEHDLNPGEIKNIRSVFGLVIPDIFEQMQGA